MTLPAREDGWQDAGQVRYTQSDIAGLQQREGSAMFTRTAVDERRQPQWSLSAHLQNQKPDGAAGETVHAVFAAWRYTRRTTDDLLSPNRGSIASVQVGAAPPGLSTEGFVRGVAQAATWIPFGRDYTLVLRAEGGAVGARTTEGIPQSFLFRTGGDTTVRGYAFETLGVRQGSAIVGGRYQALLGVEAIRWVDERWGVAAFVDAGNAVAQAADLARLPWGAGLGARIRTPLGPVRADVAWGDATREVRLHLSLGVNF
jgi:translocation and assembly module TamA